MTSHLYLPVRNLQRLTCGALLSIVFAVVFCAAAQAQELYTVTGVKVDATADSASAARSKAVADGQRKALKKLYRKLTPPDQQELIPQPSETDVRQLAVSLRVQQEKYSDVRYIATLAFEFNGNGVRQKLSEAGITYDYTNQGQVQANPPVLILPIYSTSSGTTSLWEGSNPWMQAWRRTLGSGGQYILPEGSTTDERMLSALQARNGDWLAMARLAERYGTRVVVVALAEVEADGALGVEAYRYTHGERTPLPPANPGRSAVDAPRLERAARAVLSSIEYNQPRRERQDAIANLYSEPVSLAVQVLVNDLSQWMNVQRTIRAIPIVRSVTPNALSPQLVSANVMFTGTAMDLVHALENKGLYLAETTGGWVLDDAPLAVEVPMGIGQPLPEEAPRLFEAPANRDSGQIMPIPTGQEYTPDEADNPASIPADVDGRTRSTVTYPSEPADEPEQRLEQYYERYEAPVAPAPYRGAVIHRAPLPDTGYTPESSDEPAAMAPERLPGGEVDQQPPPAAHPRGDAWDEQP